MRQTRIVVFALMLTAVAFTANAQIKVVGDDYSDSLSAAKNYYEQDIDFDAIFPSFSNQIVKGILKSWLPWPCDHHPNLTGDTIYLSETHRLERNEFSTNKNGLFDNCFEMPIGYYVISGYVFCIDNENTIRESAGLSPFEYWSYSGGPLEKTIHNLKKELLRSGSEACVCCYLRYIVLKSVDTNSAYTYYCIPELRKTIQLRFYNEARKFIGEEVVIGSISYDSIIPLKLIEDNLTGETIKLTDKSFVFKDLVLKGNDLYIILEGTRTGSFSIAIDKIKYLYDESDAHNRDDEWNTNADIASFQFGPFNYVVKKKDIKALYARPRIAQAQREREWKLKQQQLDNERKKKEEDFTRKMIAKYGSGKGTLVGKRQVAIGMTEEMVRDAWRRPMNTYRTTTKYGQSEVWCYNYKTRVYFYNGKVVQIDD